MSDYAFQNRGQCVRAANAAARAGRPFPPEGEGDECGGAGQEPCLVNGDERCDPGYVLNPLQRTCVGETGCQAETFAQDGDQLFQLINQQSEVMCVTGASVDGMKVTVTGTGLTTLGTITVEYYDDVGSNQFSDLDLATSPCVSDVTATSITVDVDCATASSPQPLVQDIRFRTDPANDPWAVNSYVGLHPYLVPCRPTSC